MPDHSVTPNVLTLGPGEPDLAVVCNVHGDEPTGARAIRRVVESSLTFDRAVKFVVANPQASFSHTRFLDVDMNRVFPGDPNADEIERRLAAAVVDETEGLDTLAIHTTHATPEPIAFVSGGDPRSLEIASRLPIASVINKGPVIDSSFSSTDRVVSIEAGRVEQPNATAKAEMLIRAFLSDTRALSEEPPMPAPETAYYELYDEIEKPSDDDSYELLARNFTQVSAGEAYAKSNAGTLTADDPFVPVLMSRSGYDDIFGYRGRKVGDSLADARAAWCDGESDRIVDQ